MSQLATKMRGKTVVALREGRDMGTVDQVYMNPSKRQVSGMTVRESRFGDHRFVQTNDVEKMGEDFIFVPRASACHKKKPAGRNLTDVIGMQVTTREGTLLGVLLDLELDKQWKVVEMDLSGKKTLKLEPREATFGDDMILVSKAAGSRVRTRSGKKKQPGFLERVFGSESVKSAIESAADQKVGSARVAQKKSSQKKSSKKKSSGKKRKTGK